jgi:hypothetical protein
MCFMCYISVDWMELVVMEAHLIELGPQRFARAASPCIRGPLKWTLLRDP